MPAVFHMTMKSNNVCKKTKCKGCLLCNTKKLKKDMFEPPKNEEIPPYAEEAQKRILDRIIRNYSGEEIMQELNKVYNYIYTIILLKSVYRSQLANGWSQFLLDRFGRCLKLFVSTESSLLPVTA